MVNEGHLPGHLFSTLQYLLESAYDWAHMSHIHVTPHTPSHPHQTSIPAHPYTITPTLPHSHQHTHIPSHPHQHTHIPSHPHPHQHTHIPSHPHYHTLQHTPTLTSGSGGPCFWEGRGQGDSCRRWPLPVWGYSQDYCPLCFLRTGPPQRAHWWCGWRWSW